MRRRSDQAQGVELQVSRGLRLGEIHQRCEALLLEFRRVELEFSRGCSEAFAKAGSPLRDVEARGFPGEDLVDIDALEVGVGAAEQGARVLLCLGRSRARAEAAERARRAKDPMLPRRLDFQRLYFQREGEQMHENVIICKTLTCSYLFISKPVFLHVHTFACVFICMNSYEHV